MFFAFNPKFVARAGFLVRHMQKNVDADGILIVHMADAPQLSRLYNALGFKELERQYIWKQKR